MRHVSIIAALTISLSAAGALTLTAHANWRSSYLMSEIGGYCADGYWHWDFRRCPEFRGVPAVQNQKRKKSKSGHVEYEIERSLFGGNESRLAQFGWFDTRCNGPAPDIRLITKPSKGSVRFEEMATTVTASKNELQKKCNGKPVNAMALYYRADGTSVGRDKIVLDADSKLGVVARYVISINVKGGAQPDSSQAGPAQRRVTRTVLKGNEARIAAPNYLNADCSSGPLPDLRVISAPKNGTYRTEEASIAAERPANDSRAACIGKPVNAVAVYYKPKDEFAGDDEMAIDVDFKNGTVRRYVYAITVR